MAKQQYEVGGLTTTENRIALGTTGIIEMFKPIEPIEPEPIEIISTLDVDRGIIADAGMAAIGRAGEYGDQGHKPDESPRSLGGNRIAAAGATVLLLTGCASAQNSELPPVAPVTASANPGEKKPTEKPAEKPMTETENNDENYTGSFEFENDPRIPESKKASIRASMERLEKRGYTVEGYRTVEIKHMGKEGEVIVIIAMLYTKNPEGIPEEMRTNY